MTSEDYTVAVQIAESLVAKTGTEIPLKDYRNSGVENEKYRWSLDISPFTIINESFDPKSATAELYKVSATVEWGDDDNGSDSRQFKIATLKLASKKNAAPQI